MAEAEVKALQQRASSLRLSIKDIEDSSKADAEKAAQRILDVALTSAEPYKKELINLKEQVEVLNGQLANREQLMQSSKHRLDVALEDIRRAEVVKTELNSAIIELGKEEILVKDAIAEREASIFPLEATKKELERDIQAKEAHQANIISLTRDLEEEFNTKKAKMLKELADIDAKLTLSSQKFTDLHKSIEAGRDEIATRTMALDKREQTLRVREHKVQIDEQSIQSNASLLDL